MKYKISLSLYVLLSCLQLYGQPLPTDKGPGNPGGSPGGNPLGWGAPVDDFIWGLIILALFYGLIKWYQIKSPQTKKDHLDEPMVNVYRDTIPSHIL